VKQALRERVVKVIEDLGYAPHGAARELASRRTHTIGAIIPTIDNGIFAEGIHYLQCGLSEANYTLLISSSNYSLDEELHEVRNFITSGVDGMVLIYGHITANQRTVALALIITLPGVKSLNTWLRWCIPTSL